MYKKIAYSLAPVASLFGIVSIAGATTYDSSTVPTAFGSVLSGLVDSIISTAISFLTDNLPVIIVLSVSVALLFWLVNKARRAISGN